MARQALLAALLLASCCTVLGQQWPAWYQCSPENCAQPDCACASFTPPAINGVPLAPADTPQFIVLTHDDAITPATNQAMRAIIDQHKNRNGCNMPATFFVLELGNDCQLAKAFYEENSEIAIHSKTHVPLVDPFPNGTAGLREEMLSARQYLNESCGIPLEDMVGYRAPQLVSNPPVRQVLAAAEPPFLYDSSNPDFFGPDSAYAKQPSDRLWPYTMDQGIPQFCGFFSGSNCTQQERYPGLWEFPMLEIQLANGTLLYSMDPGRNTSAEYGGAASGTGIPAAQLRQILETNFNFSYNYNRAPFGIFVHTPWATNESVAATNDFLEWALAKNDTYAVTMRQVIEWMKDPVPVAQMDDWLTCNPVDLSQAPGVTRCQTYQVQAGDTGAQIAAKFGVSLPDLSAINPNLETIVPGETLLIPPFDDTCGEGVPAAAPSAGTGPTATARLLV